MLITFLLVFYSFAIPDKNFSYEYKSNLATPLWDNYYLSVCFRLNEMFLDYMDAFRQAKEDENSGISAFDSFESAETSASIGWAWGCQFVI